MLPRCYQTIPYHAGPSHTASVPSVEIFEPYIVMDLGGNAPKITFNQGVPGSIPGRLTNNIGRFRSIRKRPILHNQGVRVLNSSMALC